jgi:SAM-dependent methyltransferase
MEYYDVDIVVLSNIPKDLGPDVDVKVGFPTKDPWSLPFGYKELLAKHATEYDLFIYTEDDTLITERNIEAFEKETMVLPEEYIAGFLRYEVFPDGRRAYPDMHSHFHWDVNSVVRFGNSLFAYHTNEHSACFILTQGQLRKAINSGGFMLPPRIGRYDMLVTAATEPYTGCGMKKLICISRLDDFSLHHLPNVYLGILGLDEAIGKLEVERLISLASCKTELPPGPLFEPYPLRDSDRWNKQYYEAQRDDVMDLVPRDARSVLSIGCGCGNTEAVLVNRGIRVTGIPLDAIVSAVVETRGIEILPPDFELASKKLEGRQFDCILILDILQQVRNPVSIMNTYRGFLRDGGAIIVSVPNWNYYGTLRQRLTVRGRAGLECRATARSEGVHRTSKTRVTGWLYESGFRRFKHGGTPGPRLEKISRWTFGLADGVLCRNIVISARRR